jgi:hypothetical protein
MSYILYGLAFLGFLAVLGMLDNACQGKEEEED